MRSYEELLPRTGTFAPYEYAFPLGVSHFSARTSFFVSPEVTFYSVELIRGSFSLVRAFLPRTSIFSLVRALLVGFFGMTLRFVIARGWPQV